LERYRKGLVKGLMVWEFSPSINGGEWDSTLVVFIDYGESTPFEPDTVKVETSNRFVYKSMEFPEAMDWECTDTLNEIKVYRTCCTEITYDTLNVDPCIFFHTYKVDADKRVIEYDGAGSGFFARRRFQFNDTGQLIRAEDFKDVFLIDYNEHGLVSAVTNKYDGEMRGILKFIYNHKVTPSNQ